MKTFRLFILSAIILALAWLGARHLPLLPNSTSAVGSTYLSEASEGTADNPLARLEYEWQRLHDPATGQIPQGIAQRELDFVHRLAQQPGLQALTADEAWVSRGPYNIGGRTKALALDATNENVILAGSVSSGMFKSTDGGRSWRKTTAPNQLHSVTSIAQNRAPGREHIWYYGTGDRSPTIGSGEVNSGVAHGGGTNAFYRGDGIFKSVDGGDTWTLLPSTRSGTPHQTDPFDFVWDVVTFGEDGVFAATSAGLFKSTDGGASWTTALDFGGAETYPSTEIARAKDGTFYATIGGDGPANGIYRSVDGASWENITPPGWPASTVRTLAAPAPSNEDVVYFYTEVAHLQQQLRKYDAASGWTDLTAKLPFNAQLATYGGVLMVFEVKPDDEDTFFLGAINLFRSTDGGRTYEEISGRGGNEFHVDQTSLVFYPSNPRRMIVGNDGGLYRTDDNTAATNDFSLDWEPLNNGYLTTQFYTTAIDQGTPGSDAVIGGTQDNGVVYTRSPDSGVPWLTSLGNVDGAFTAITDGGDYFYSAAAATFRLIRHSFAGSVEQITNITPASGRLGLWLTIFQLDPHDQKVMYLPSQRTLFRNADLTAIPHQPGGGPTDVNWDTFDHVTDHYITALGMSGATPRRLYYAGLLSNQTSRLLYLDNPQAGQPVPVDITGTNFPLYPYPPLITCISVDPRDANKVMVVFPNYGVLSIYASNNGGQTWTPVSGNLEENPDGTGSGPSVRWVTTLYVKNQPVYLAGTSVGLFSATQLDGMNTIWTPEAASTIGNVLVPMIAVRQSDGFVAVATHGNGVYSTYLTEIPSSVSTDVSPRLPSRFALHGNYPNPFNPTTTFSFDLAEPARVRLTVYDLAGRLIATVVSAPLPAGQHTRQWEARGLSSGVYLYRLEAGAYKESRMLTLVK